MYEEEKSPEGDSKVQKKDAQPALSFRIPTAALENIDSMVDCGGRNDQDWRCSEACEFEAGYFKNRSDAARKILSAPDIVDLMNSSLSIEQQGDRIIFHFAGDIQGHPVSFAVRLAQGVAILPIHEFVVEQGRRNLRRFGGRSESE